MSKSEELLKLAQAANWDVPQTQDVRNNNTALANLCDPETIQQLVELVRLQNAALEFASDFIPMEGCKTGECEVCQALEAFDKLEGR